MKRYGHLWEGMISFENLLRAAEKARRGKRFKPGAARFFFRLEPELLRLQEELANLTYRPGPYRTFTIYEGKPRQISAAPFRDRVVHHALTGILEPIFERSFIHDSYACRKGKGTHAAVNRCQHFARRHAYVLKADVRKYFPSIDHAILKELIARRIKDPSVLHLVSTIIDHSNPQPSVIAWFPGDDLFTPIERRRGLPLGNQTSQFFANVYLDPLDKGLNPVSQRATAALSFRPSSCPTSITRPCSRSASVQPVSRCSRIANSSVTRLVLPPIHGRMTQPSSNRTFQPSSVGTPTASVLPRSASSLRTTCISIGLVTPPRWSK